jgi:hypothetical protein
MASRIHLRVALVVPPYPHYPVRGLEFAHESPLACFSTIATLLERAGASVSIFDWRGQTLDRCLEYIGLLAAGYDVCGITCFSNSYVFLTRFVPALRSEAPRMLLVLGGPLLSSCPEILLRDSGAQIGMLGEGEVTFLNLLREKVGRATDLSQLEGVCVVNDHGVIFAKRQETAFPLERAPFPNLSLWPSVAQKGHCRALYYEGSRGCPYTCKMCYRPFPGLRSKPADRIGKDFGRLAREYRTEFVFFTDGTFNWDVARVCAMCDAVGPSGVGWGCMARPQGITRAIAAAMVDAGCRVVRFGVESFDNASLRGIGKGLTEREIEASVEAALDVGLEVTCWFLVGLETETKEMIRKNLRFLDKYPVVPRPHYLIPLPGTPLGSQALESRFGGNVRRLLVYLSEEGDGRHYFSLSALPRKTTEEYYFRLRELQAVRGRTFEEGLWYGSH